MADPFAAVAGVPEVKAGQRASSRTQGAKQFFDVLQNEAAAERVEQAIFALTNNADDKNYRMRIRQVISVLKQERFGVLREGIVREMVDLHDLVTTKTNAAAVKPNYLSDIKEKLKTAGESESSGDSPSTTGNNSKASSPDDNSSEIPAPTMARSSLVAQAPAAVVRPQPGGGDNPFASAGGGSDNPFAASGGELQNYKPPQAQQPKNTNVAQQNSTSVAPASAAPAAPAPAKMIPPTSELHQQSPETTTSASSDKMPPPAGPPAPSAATRAVPPPVPEHPSPAVVQQNTASPGAVLPRAATQTNNRSPSIGLGGNPFEQIGGQPLPVAPVRNNATVAQPGGDGASSTAQPPSSRGGAAPTAPPAPSAAASNKAVLDKTLIQPLSVPTAPPTAPTANAAPVKAPTSQHQQMTRQAPEQNQKAAPQQQQQHQQQQASTSTRAPPEVAQGAVLNGSPSPRGVSMPPGGSGEKKWAEQEKMHQMAHDSITARLNKLRENKSSLAETMHRTRETVQREDFFQQGKSSMFRRGPSDPKSLAGPAFSSSTLSGGVDRSEQFERDKAMLESERAALEREKTDFEADKLKWKTDFEREKASFAEKAKTHQRALEEEIESLKSQLEKATSSAALNRTASETVTEELAALKRQFEAEREKERKVIDAERKRLEVEKQVFKRKQQELQARSEQPSSSLQQTPALLNDDLMAHKYECLKEQFRVRSKELQDVKMENQLFKRLEAKRAQEYRISEDELKYTYDKRIQQLATLLEEKDGHIKAIEERLAAEIQRKIKISEETKQRENMLVRQKEMLREQHMREKDLTRKLRSASLSASMQTNQSLINSTSGTKPPLPPSIRGFDAARNPFQKYRGDGYASSLAKSPNEGTSSVDPLEQRASDRANPFLSDFPLSDFGAGVNLGSQHQQQVILNHAVGRGSSVDSFNPGARRVGGSTTMNSSIISNNHFGGGDNNSLGGGAPGEVSRGRGGSSSLFKDHDAASMTSNTPMSHQSRGAAAGANGSIGGGHGHPPIMPTGGPRSTSSLLVNPSFAASSSKESAGSQRGGGASTSNDFFNPAAPAGTSKESGNTSAGAVPPPPAPSDASTSGVAGQQAQQQPSSSPFDQMMAPPPLRASQLPASARSNAAAKSLIPQPVNGGGGGGTSSSPFDTFGGGPGGAAPPVHLTSSPFGAGPSGAASVATPATVLPHHGSPHEPPAPVFSTSRGPSPTQPPPASQTGKSNLMNNMEDLFSDMETPAAVSSRSRSLNPSPPNVAPVVAPPPQAGGSQMNSSQQAGGTTTNKVVPPLNLSRVAGDNSVSTTGTSSAMKSFSKPNDPFATEDESGADFFAMMAAGGGTSGGSKTSNAPSTGAANGSVNPPPAGQALISTTGTTSTMNINGLQASTSHNHMMNNAGQGQGQAPPLFSAGATASKTTIAPASATNQHQPLFPAAAPTATSTFPQQHHAPSGLQPLSSQHHQTAVPTPLQQHHQTSSFPHQQQQQHAPLNKQDIYHQQPQQQPQVSSFPPQAQQQQQPQQSKSSDPWASDDGADFFAGLRTNAPQAASKTATAPTTQMADLFGDGPGSLF
ncbi:unnamed protein product [Amoebophrya sp. A25]|nr:unnamed protein product [Amoebophrya sp. A25]|eukprot:GSA25T00023977001.1